MNASVNSNINPTPLAVPQVLWVDDDANILQSAERLFRDGLLTLRATTSAAQAREWMRTEVFAVIIADQNLENGSERGIELLEYSKRQTPTTTRVLLTGIVDHETLEEAVNRGAVFRLISKPWDNDELKLDMEKAIEHHRLQIAQAGLLREVTRQNKRLEEMTSGLEKLVAERTLDAERSKHEAEKQLAHVRDLVRFIKDLSTLTSVEELILLMHKSLRAFSALRAPILAYIATERRPLIVTLQGKQIVSKEVRQAWPQSARLRINELEDRVYLANEFSRPFAKVIAVPLKRRMSTSESPLGSTATLFFEHSLDDEQVEHFLGFFSERLQPLSIALDRIILEYYLKYTSYQWESTFDGIKDPIALIDIEYRIIRANRHFHSGGYRATCHQVFADSDSVCRGCPVAQALATGLPQTGQVRRGKQTFQVHSYPIKASSANSATNVINYYVDVTDARELHGRVVQSEKMAAIGLLAGNIAHELNNPLTGIRSLAQVLLSEVPPTTTLYSDMNEIEKAAARSQRIIENLLDFSKGGSEDKAVPVSLNEIISRTLPMLKTAMREHRSEIYLCEAPVEVRVEPHLMQQVVFNLVNNGCQAMIEPGTIMVETSRSTDGKFCELRVTDTGPGIAPEIRENIFEPFFTTKKEGQGTGLGLSMSHTVIQKFGGELIVESEPGHGASFVVRLPSAN